MTARCCRYTERGRPETVIRTSLAFFVICTLVSLAGMTPCSRCGFLLRTCFLALHHFFLFVFLCVQFISLFLSFRLVLSQSIKRFTVCELEVKINDEGDVGEAGLKSARKFAIHTHTHARAHAHAPLVHFAFSICAFERDECSAQQIIAKKKDAEKEWFWILAWTAPANKPSTNKSSNSLVCK